MAILSRTLAFGIWQPSQGAMCSAEHALVARGAIRREARARTDGNKVERGGTAGRHCLGKHYYAAGKAGLSLQDSK